MRARGDRPAASSQSPSRDDADSGENRSRTPVDGRQAHLRAVPAQPLGDPLENAIATEDLPLIPEGVYEAFGGKASFFRAHNTDKLAVQWKVRVRDRTQRDGFITIPVSAYYNITRLGRDRFRVGLHSRYRRDWTAAANRRPARSDRLSPKIFFGILAEVEVATVTKNGEQRPLHEHARYSKVKRIVACLAGGGPAR